MTANEIAERVKADLERTGGGFNTLRRLAEIELDFWTEQERKDKADYYATYLVILEKLQNEKNN